MATIRKRKLPSGKVCWLVDFNDANGKRRARQFETRRRADEFMVRARAEVSTGLYVHDSDAITVKDASEMWLATCRHRLEAKQRMERATYRDYESKVRLHILDADAGIGSIKLSRLTKKSIREFRERLLIAGRSEAQVRKVLSVAKLIVSHAQEEGHIVQNPVIGIRVIRTSRTDMQVCVPDKKDIRNLIDASSGWLRTLIIVAAFCGLRASETRALVWSDIDFEKGLININRRADAYNEIGEPKSSAGVRSVPMGPFVGHTLKSWKLSVGGRQDDLLFPSKHGGVQSHSNILKRHFKPLSHKLNIVMRWHDLRHFAISVWIEQGFSIKEVMTFAGHKSVQMTMERYGHLFPSPDHQLGMAEIEKRILG